MRPIAALCLCVALTGCYPFGYVRAEPHEAPAFLPERIGNFRLTAARRLNSLIPYQPTPEPAEMTPVAPIPEVASAPVESEEVAPGPSAPMPAEISEPQPALARAASSLDRGPTPLVPTSVSQVEVRQAQPVTPLPSPGDSGPPPIPEPARCADGTSVRDFKVVPGRTLSEQLSAMTYEAGYARFLKDTGRWDWTLRGEDTLRGCLVDAVDQLLALYDDQQIRPHVVVRAASRELVLRRYP